MNPSNPTPIGLSVRDAAGLSSLSEWEIREAVNSGEIPAVRRGRRIVIDYDAFRAWLRSQPPVVESA